MFVIVVYDVKKSRASTILKICRKYLHRVQNSVFEGTISESDFKRFKKEISQIVVLEEDAVCIYKLESVKYVFKEELGHVLKGGHIL